MRGTGRAGAEPCRTLPSAGGNAGLAAAYAAKKLGLPITVVIPSTAGPATVRKLEELGAEVEVSGQVTPRSPLNLGSRGDQRGLSLSSAMTGTCVANPILECPPSCTTCTPASWQGHPRDPPAQPSVPCGFLVPPAP